MAQLAFAVVGGIIGGPIGWAIGAAVGQALFPGSVPDQTGPRLGDLRVQQSQYGTAIPILYGTTRISGNVIWSSPLLETVTTTEAGGKGSPSQSQTTYSYRVSLAIMLCRGPVIGIRKIWADGKLIYNFETSADIQTAISSQALTPNISFYPGNETQLADPTMQAYLGAANVPAYRGRAYVVLSDFQLEAYGNRRPNFTFEVVATGTVAPTRTLFDLPDPPYVSGGYEGMAHNGDQIIAIDVGAPAGLSRSFDDGETWSAVSQFTSVYTNARFIGFHLGLWIIHTGSDLFYSEDGYAWTRVTYAEGANTSVTGMASNGNRIVIISTSQISSSANGRTWTRESITPQFWGEIAWSGTHFVSVASSGEVIRSATGLPGSWEYGDTLLAGSAMTSIASSGSVLVVMDTVNPRAIRSADHGVTWAAYSVAVTCHRVCWSGEFFVAVRNSASTVNAYHRSYDGITWEAFSQPTSVPLWILMPKNGLIYSIGQSVSTNRKLAVLRFDTLAPTAVPLSSIVSNICNQAQLAPGDIDVSALTDSVDGYSIGRQTSARSALEPLQKAFYFDAVESDGKIVFRKRGGAVVATIDANDLAASASGDEPPDDLSITRQQEVELPSVLSVVYSDTGSDYQQNMQKAERGAVLSTQETSVELPIAMSASKARSVAETLLYDSWTQRLSFSFTTSREYAALEPADVVSLVRNGTTYTLRLMKKTESRSGVIQWEAVAEEASVYTQSIVGGSGVSSQSEVLSAPPTFFVPMDAPMLRDEDDNAGFYSAAAGFNSGWKGAVVYRSSDGGASYDDGGAVTSSATFGTVVGTLWNQNFHPNVFDEGTLINVELRSGTLSSATVEAVLNGANTLLVGSEVLQFKNAVLYATKTYQLSGILRGRRGTEWAMGGHAASGETVVVLSEATLRRFTTELNSARLYKAVSIGRSIQETASQSFTYNGINQMAFAGVHLGAGRNASGDITIGWLRRSRSGISLPWNYDPPVGETSQQYDVEIWNSSFSTLRRTFSLLTTPTATYTSAQQGTDSGGVLATYGVRVYQRNAVMGRGYVLQGVI